MELHEKSERKLDQIKKEARNEYRKKWAIIVFFIFGSFGTLTYFKIQLDSLKDELDNTRSEIENTSAMVTDMKDETFVKIRSFLESDTVKQFADTLVLRVVSSKVSEKVEIITDEVFSPLEEDYKNKIAELRDELSKVTILSDYQELTLKALSYDRFAYEELKNNPPSQFKTEIAILLPNIESMAFNSSLVWDGDISYPLVLNYDFEKDSTAIAQAFEGNNNEAKEGVLSAFIFENDEGSNILDFINFILFQESPNNSSNITRRHRISENVINKKIPMKKYGPQFGKIFSYYLKTERNLTTCVKIANIIEQWDEIDDQFDFDAHIAYWESYEPKEPEVKEEIFHR